MVESPYRNSRGIETDVKKLWNKTNAGVGTFEGAVDVKF